MAADLSDLKGRIRQDKLNGKVDESEAPKYTEVHFKSAGSFEVWKQTQLNKVERSIRENVSEEYLEMDVSNGHTIDVIYGYKLLLETLFR